MVQAWSSREGCFSPMSAMGFCRATCKRKTNYLQDPGGVKAKHFSIYITIIWGYFIEILLKIDEMFVAFIVLGYLYKFVIN